MSGFLYVYGDEEHGDRSLELPLEEDGSLLMSTLTSHFRASGLKYK